MEKIRLFYVDDDETHRLAVAMMLLNEPRFELTECRDAVEILARLDRGEKCDVLLTDCNMPVMNGYELVGALRAKESFQDIRILMFTINNEWEDVARSLKAGVNEYLMKPFNKEMLISKIDLLTRG